MRFSLAKLLTGVSIVAILIAAFVAYRSYFQPRRFGTSSSIANRMIWSGFKLPHNASDVTYHVDFGGCEAEFAISESDFLEWCNDRGWVPERIARPIAYFQPVLLSDNDTIVTDGYTFDVPDGKGVFDAGRSRTAFWASTFP